MPKPFWIANHIRNFTGSGTIYGQAQTLYDRRVEWVTRQPRLTSFGDTPSFRVVEVQIYTSTPTATFAEGLRTLGSSGFVCGLYSSTGWPEKIDADGNIEWEFDDMGTATYALTARNGIVIDEPNDRVFVGTLRAGDSPAGTVSCCKLSDGSTIYAEGGSTGASGFDLRTVIYDEVANELIVCRHGSTSFYRFNAGTGGLIESWNPVPTGVWRTGGSRSGDRFLFPDTNTVPDAWYGFQLPASAAGNDDPIWSIDSTDMTITGTYNLNSLYVSSCSDEVGGGWWVVNEIVSNRYVHHVTADGVVDLEFDTAPYFGSMAGCQLFVACDLFGALYVAKYSTTAGAARAECAKFEASGTHVWTIEDCFPAHQGLMGDVAVDGSGNVCITQFDGYVTIIQQS